MEYNFLADLLNKFSQLTPWIQSIVAVAVVTIAVAPFYFFKESVKAIVNRNKPPEAKQNWKDKYYRDENIKA